MMPRTVKRPAPRASRRRRHMLPARIDSQSAPLISLAASSPMPRSLETILTTFGWRERFHIHERIGEGGMGQVWRAQDRESGREVALKILLPGRSGDEHSLARIEVEGATLMRLRAAGGHDHVVPILDFKVTQDHACLVMEFIPGQSLRKWCSSHRLGLRERAGLIARVARAAGWFHQLGVIHRDLKPANILVSAHTHEPVIVDFSIAKTEETLTLTLTNEALGTAPYMAPEQFDRRRAPLCPATDVYALGTTLYELLTEVPPHPGDLPVILQRHADEARPARPSALNPAIPRDLESILLKALAHRPADRYADGTALADDLERFLAGQPVHARPISRLTHLLRQARKKPALTAALAACISLGALAAWSAHHRAAEREIFLMESALITALQQREWTRPALLREEAALAALQARSPRRAVYLRQRLLDDVADDLSLALQKNHLTQADFTWMQDTLEWLTQAGAKESATALHRQLLLRQTRWEQLDELRPPIAKLGAFFPGRDVELRKDGHLHITGSPGQVRDIVARKELTLPLQITAEWTGEPGHLGHTGVALAHASIETRALLCPAGSAPPAVLALLEEKGTPPQPGHTLLALLQNQEVLAVRDLERLDLSQGSLRLSLRLEPRRIEAVVNDARALAADSDLTLGSTVRANTCHLLWPAGAGLRSLSLSNRLQQQPGLLEEADLLLLQSRWLDAGTLYESLLGDPAYGAEARYKLAHCRRRMGDPAAAIELWTQLAVGSPGKWSDRAAYHLWAFAAHDQGVAAAASYIPRVPGNLPRQVLWEFGRSIATKVEHIYVREGYGISLPGISPARVSAADRAFDILQKPLLQRVNRFGMALHMARLDEQAAHLHRKALEDPKDTAFNTENLRAVSNVFDQWSRISAPATAPYLVPTLERWQRALPRDATLGCLHQLELARRAARTGRDTAAALSHAQAARADATADDRRRVTAWLIEGMLHRFLNDEPRAQECWHEALKISRSVRFRAPLHLWDCAILRSLTRTWDLESATGILGHLVTMDTGNALADSRSQALSRFQQEFLADGTFLEALNSLSAGSRKFEHLAEDHAFCQDTPRSLLQRFYHLLFERWFLLGAFPPHPASEDQQRVQRAVSQLITRMTLQPESDATDLHACFKAWHDPAAARLLLQRTDYPHPPDLVEDLKWLLRQRHRL